MIIARSPLRVTLGGGGTDLPSYYREHEGFLLSAAIDKYVFVTVTRPFTEGIYLKYSHLEHVDKIAEVQHPIIRHGCARFRDNRPTPPSRTLRPTTKPEPRRFRRFGKRSPTPRTRTLR